MSRIERSFIYGNQLSHSDGTYSYISGRQIWHYGFNHKDHISHIYGDWEIDEKGNLILPNGLTIDHDNGTYSYVSMKDYIRHSTGGYSTVNRNIIYHYGICPWDVCGKWNSCKICIQS